jgi:hypothetical protein
MTITDRDVPGQETVPSKISPRNVVGRRRKPIARAWLSARLDQLNASNA